MITIYRNNFFNSHFILRCIWRISWRFLPEDFSTIFIKCPLNSSTSSCSLHIRLPSFSIRMKSLERQPILVEKGLTVSQKFLFVIIPSFVAYLKKSPLTFSFKELHLFLVLLYEIEFSLDGQFKFVFFFCFKLSYYSFPQEVQCL